MAINRICSVEGCGNTYKAKGFCDKHYQKQRIHGTSPGIYTEHGVAEKFFYENCAKETQDCILWPYTTTKQGYGQFRRNKIDYKVHRLSCTLACGPPPTDKHETAHSCGNRACFNKLHVRWATPKENQADRLIHGTDARCEKSPVAKLTNENVRNIRARCMFGEKQLLLAIEFNVTQTTISNIFTRKHWRFLEE